MFQLFSIYYTAASLHSFKSKSIEQPQLDEQLISEPNAFHVRSEQSQSSGYGDDRRKLIDLRALTDLRAKSRSHRVPTIAEDKKGAPELTAVSSLGIQSLYGVAGWQLDAIPDWIEVEPS